MKKILLFIIASLLMAAQVNATTQHFNLKFSAMVGSENFACGKSYDDIGVTRSRITPSDFRFYVSGVELIDKRGKSVPVKLDQDGIWQYKDIALLDFEDGQGPCRNGNPGLHTAVTGSVPKGNYRGVRFTLGIPFELNHGDPTIAPAPLSFTSMFWVWQTGYKFVKIDMASSGLPQATDALPEMALKDRLAAMEKFAAIKGEAAPVKKSPRAAGFSVHLGSTDCASPSLTTPPAGCKNPNRLTVTFDKFDASRNVIVADMASLLQDANVDVNAPDTAPGCMSGLNDDDCPPVIAAFGLPFNDRPAVTQRFFRIR